MSSFDNPKSTLATFGLAPSKQRGQNFLVNARTAERIVDCAQIHSTDCVVEVGVGLGALTKPIARRAKHVIGIEIDSGIIHFHDTEKTLPENVTLIHGDILKLDFQSLYKQTGGTFKVLANLPYSISNPFIFKVIDNRQYIKNVTVMLQAEVAERLTAAPGSKAYGIPTIMLSSCAHVQKLLTLKPAEFHPRPKIDSEVIHVTFFKRAGSAPFHLFQKIVRTSFSSRRKTILNNLSSPSLFLSGTKDKKECKRRAEQLLEEVDIAPRTRAERLTLAQFESLAVAYTSLLSRL